MNDIPLYITDIGHNTLKGLEKTEKGESLERKSTSNDDYKPEDSQFDIMIRNNENLITALIGKSDGDSDTNLAFSFDLNKSIPC